jgi:hypothetical protein
MAAAWLFRLHLLGDFLLIGNSDRINTSLNISEHYIESIKQGRLDAWDAKMFGGVNTLGLPYIFPSPITALEALVPKSQFIYVAGLVSCLLFACAGWAAYAFLFDATKSWFGASVASVLYQFSAISTLKVNQNDPSFAVLIVIPLLMLGVRKIERTRVSLPFLLLAFLFFSMLEFMFLQKAAYATMLVMAYALYRSVNRRTWMPIVVSITALVVGTVGAFPRIVTIGEEMALLQRTQSPPRSPPLVYMSILGHQFKGSSRPLPLSDLSRIFDYGLFGRWPSEAAEKTSTNLSEGMYLYSSAFAVFLIILGALTRRFLHFDPHPAGASEYTFHLGAFLLILAIPYFGLLNHLMFLAFLGRDFIHYRVVIAALLPMCCLTAFLLRDWGADLLLPWCWKHRLGWCLAFAAAALVWTILVYDTQGGMNTWMRVPGLFRDHPFLVRPVVRRLWWSAGIFGLLLVLSQFRVNGFAVRRAAGIVLGSLMILEATWAADGRVNGPQNQSAVAFLGGNCGGNILLASPDQFHPPSAQALGRFAERLETDEYRCLLQRNFGQVPCRAEPHVAQLWGLRIIDGYSSGVPACLMSLPWPEAATTPRSISFDASPRGLPWELLSLLNVKYAVVINDELLRNHISDANGNWREVTPADVQIRTNPLPVVPRVFFTSKTIPSKNASQSARQIFRTGRPSDITECSFVEGTSAPEEFGDPGPISYRFDGDRARLQFEPRNVDRFVVLNERFHPCWHAYCNGSEIPVYQTNAFMQGARVPAGSDHIDLRFIPFVLNPWSIFFYVGALVVLGCGWRWLRRIEIRNQSAIP